MGLLLGLVGFRALGSLVQSGDENDLVLRDCIPLLFQVATIYTQNPSDISLLEEHWVQRYKLWYDVQCPSGVDALDDASAPPSALCQQMMEMGFPREWCDVALLKCSYQVEAAINFCFEHSSDMDRLVKQPTARSTGRAPSPPTSSTSTRPDSIPQGPNPLRPVSGLATINDDMLVEGSAGGGFASVGAPDCIVQTGKWYYEATLSTSGCIQIGWADAAFSGASERGDGVGDGPHSWAYDGWRQMKWHGNSSSYGIKWKSGDVIGCGVDCDAGLLFFTLNGQYMGVAFRGVQFAGGIFYKFEVYL
ncbi:hypothetical protein DYB25_012230 [Aphanomyces astaci]|uniref:B30.2/SPRY domain-containing protein n=1 Tax=Aphanomyces astaci TaxID=112090 RepID=A0A396ZXR5_APHAT|nr:hypothetical protein DYB25_012230 [Aphanomyces astaci]